MTRIICTICLELRTDTGVNIIQTNIDVDKSNVFQKSRELQPNSHPVEGRACGKHACMTQTSIRYPRQVATVLGLSSIA